MQHKHPLNLKQPIRAFFPVILQGHWSFLSVFLLILPQPEIEEWSSWDEEGPTSIKIEGGNGNLPAPQDDQEEEEPDYFKDMAPTIRKTQKVLLH